MLIKNTETRIVEPVVVDRTDAGAAWYSAPWAIALFLVLLVVIGLIAYTVGNPPATNTVSHSVYEKTVTSAPSSTSTQPTSGATTIKPNITINTPPPTTIQVPASGSNPGTSGANAASGSNNSNTTPNTSQSGDGSGSTPAGGSNSSDSSNANDGSKSGQSSSSQTSSGDASGSNQ